MVTFLGKNMNFGYGVLGIGMHNYYVFNDGNSNKQLLDTYLTLKFLKSEMKFVLFYSKSPIITIFILRMSNVI